MIVATWQRSALLALWIVCLAVAFRLAVDGWLELTTPRPTPSTIPTAVLPDTRDAIDVIQPRPRLTRPA